MFLPGPSYLYEPLSQYTVFVVQVSTSNPSAPGWSHVVQMYDSFKLTGPHGTRILPSNAASAHTCKIMSAWPCFSSCHSLCFTSVVKYNQYSRNISRACGFLCLILSHLTSRPKPFAWVVSFVSLSICKDR